MTIPIIDSTPTPADGGRERVFSGIKPTGHLTLGNYLGALRRFATMQDEADCLFSIVDLHALTVPHRPADVRALAREVATLFLAAGLDPGRCTVFCQSAVPAHTELAYLLECTGHVGELERMIQYKEKGRGNPSTRVSLLTYPILMTADILLYDIQAVPVGDDQRQHVELARDLAIRFNRTYGDTFVVPELRTPPVAARVMDLQEPRSKMGKTTAGDAGIVYLLDPPELVRRKVMRAVTDSDGEVAYDPTGKPGVSNLLDILAACSGTGDPGTLAAAYPSYGALKSDTADAVISMLEPIQASYAALAADPAAVHETLHAGAEHAAAIAAPTVVRAKRAIGLLD